MEKMEESINNTLTKELKEMKNEQTEVSKYWN